MRKVIGPKLRAECDAAFSVSPCSDVFSRPPASLYLCSEATCGFSNYIFNNSNPCHPRPLLLCTTVPPLLSGRNCASGPAAAAAPSAPPHFLTRGNIVRMTVALRPTSFVLLNYVSMFDRSYVYRGDDVNRSVWSKKMY